MIIRSLLLRHGRLALAKPPPPVRSWRRYLATEVERFSNPFENQQVLESDVDGSESPAINSPESTQAQVPADHQVARDWDFFQHQKAVTGQIGTSVAPHYRPHELLTNPPSPKDISLELLLASQAHLGHATSLWNPANARYIFGIREGIHIISLDVTASHLRRACKVVHGVTSRGGLVLFVGTRDGQARAVVKAAEMAKGCHLFDRWIPGSITNGQQILGKCAKRVVNEMDEVVPGFESQLVDKAALKPDLVICLNPLENYVLLHECGLNNIPTIGIIDTDANPTWVTYPIPANDDSLRSVQVIAGVLGSAGQEGQELRLAKAQQGVVSYVSTHGLQSPEGELTSGENEYTKAQERAARLSESGHPAAEMILQSREITELASDLVDFVDADPAEMNEIAERFAADQEDIQQRFQSDQLTATDETLDDVQPADAPELLEEMRRARAAAGVEGRSTNGHELDEPNEEFLTAMENELITPEEADAEFRARRDTRPYPSLRSTVGEHFEPPAEPNGDEDEILTQIGQARDKAAKALEPAQVGSISGQGNATSEGSQNAQGVTSDKEANDRRRQR